MADRMGMALRLAKEGRPEGFRFLYDYTCEPQISMALDYLGDEASANSVVQQAYQQVFDGISNVTQPEMFEPWVRDMVSYFSGQEIRMRTQDAFSESEDATYILEEDDMAITEAMDEESLAASYTPEDVSRMATELLT